MKPLAIIGFGPSHTDAPWQDEGWERWGMPNDPENAPRCHMLFEMHARSRWGGTRNYIDRMNDLEVPIYMQQTHHYVPMSIEYPLDEIRAMVGDYFGSSIAYMLAMAIWQHRERMDLFGVDLSEDIYDHHRPNLEYLIGFARGQGMTVNVPPGSQLLSFDSSKFEIHYPVRYGFEGPA